MPEGDTIHRAARTLHLALANRVVTSFTSVFPHLTRIDEAAPLTGRVVERVDARGKHLLIRFSGDLVLRTHMRMHGSWHIYRPGERWQRPRHEMRIVIETAGMHAIGFNVPEAELVTTAALERDETFRQIGPDLRRVARSRSGRCQAPRPTGHGDRRCPPRSDGRRRHRQRVQVRGAVRRADQPGYSGLGDR